MGDPEDQLIRVSPSKSLVYGGDGIKLTFPEKRPLLGEQYILTFQGQRQRHVCASRITSRYMLEARIPEHHLCEVVQLTVLENTRSELSISLHQPFSFMYDSAYHIAIYCLNSVYDVTALENCDHIHTEHFTMADEVYGLDDRLTKAFEYLDIPEGWNLLGLDSTLPDPEPRETLLHFAARCGLEKFATFLLTIPNSRTALNLPNRFRELPVHIAQQRRFHSLSQILSPYNNNRSRVWQTSKKSAAPAVKVNRHGDGLASVTTDLTKSYSSLESEIAVLNSVLARISSPAASEEIDSWLHRSRSASGRTYAEIESDDSEEDIYHTTPSSQNQRPQVTYRRHTKPKTTSSYHEQHHYKKHKHVETRRKPVYERPGSNTPYKQDNAPQEPKPEQYQHILEDNLQRLHNIIEGNERVRQVNTQQLQQDVLKGSLGKLSTSCPSLADAELKVANGDDTDLTGHYKSMLNIAPDDEHQYDMSQKKQKTMRTPVTGMPTVDSEVRICINDVTMDSSEDFHTQTEDYSSDVYQLKKKDKRRSSWCPEEGRKAEEKREKKQMLSITGKSQSLSSLDGNDDSEDEDNSDASISSAERVPFEQSSKESTPLQARAKDDCGLNNNKISPFSVTPISNRSEVSPRQNQSFSPGDVHFDISAQDSEDLNGSGDQSPQGSAVNLESPPDVLPVPGGSLIKSISSPAIPGDGLPDNETSEDVDGSSASLSMPKSSSTSDVVEQDGEGSEVFAKSDNSQSSRPVSGDLSDSGHGDSEENIIRARRTKPRRPSFMEKLGYKQKKQLKKSTHQFVTICFSNSTLCDFCQKSLCNKSALQCENCLVSIHENSCQDQIAACAKSKNAKVETSRDKTYKHSISVTEGAQLTTKGPIRKERAMSAPSKNSQQVALSSPSGSIKASQQSSVNGAALNTTGYFQWRRVATKLGIDKVLRDEKPTGEAVPSPSEVQPASTPTLGNSLETTNINETLSVSMESLDEGANTELQDFEEDPDFLVTLSEAEAWSVTVDKKTLKKMSNKDIKRQDHIWELIQTEKNHCMTLRVMQKIYGRGMIQDLHMGQEMVDRVFPQIDELLEIHLSFLQKLLERQRLKPDKSIECIGDLLIEQFEGELGKRLKDAYGEFCSSHIESVQLYKELLKEKRFQVMIKKFSRLSIIKHRGVPECILLVTQRMTKYPLLIESILKTTKENRIERENLMKAKLLAKDILNHIDQQVDMKEKQKRLMDIYSKLDARSSTMLNSSKFKKADLLLHSRKLLHEGPMKWISARGKPIDVTAVLLSDVIFFLQENNQKYTFVAVDNKPGVLGLSELIVREKSDNRDGTGMFLIRRGETPDMYHIVCRSMDDRDKWIERLQKAIKKCPEEDQGVSFDTEEDRKRLDETCAKIQRMIEDLHLKDCVIRNSCDDKLKILLEMCAVWGWTNINLKGLPLDADDKPSRDPRLLLQAAQQEASRMSMLVQQYGSHSNVLSRSVSSVETTTCTPPPLPKRAATIGAFETKGVSSMKKRHGSGSGNSKDGSSPSNGSLLNLNVPDAESSHNNDTSSSRFLALRRSSVGVALTSNTINSFKDRASRRMSTSVLQSLLAKAQSDKDEGDKSSDRGSDKEVDSSPASSFTAGLNLGLPSHEICHSLAQMMQYINTFSEMIIEKETEYHSLRGQLIDSQTKLSQLEADLKQYAGQEKRHGFHDKQLEELRNLQESINQERLSWDKEKLQQQERLDYDRNEVDQAQRELLKQKDEIRAQREELQRQKEALQKQVDFYQITPRGDSPPRNPQLDTIVHKRSNSDDLLLIQGRATDDRKSSKTHSLGESDSLTHPVARQRPQSASASSSINRTTSNREVPLHLISATNERKISAMSQQLPAKLASTKPNPGLKSTTSASSLSQVLPMKLSSMSMKGSVINRTQSMTMNSNFSTNVKNQPVQSILPMKLAESSRSKSLSPSSLGSRSSPGRSDPSSGSPQGQGQGQKDHKYTKEEIYL